MHSILDHCYGEVWRWVIWGVELVVCWVRFGGEGVRFRCVSGCKAAGRTSRKWLC